MKSHRTWTWAPAALLGVLVAVLAALADETDAPPPAQQEPPKLVVLVVFDQLRADYLERWRPLFVKGGFRRLLDEGAWYQNCHYPYAGTVTAAGHASMSTGCLPRTHGIIENGWYDRGSGALIAAVQVKQFRPVPAPTGKDADKILGAAPTRLLRPTVGDALHKGTNGKGKVVSLSLKDRAAVLLAALQRGVCSCCYWFSTTVGAFVTSTFYADAPHKWVDQFNKEKHQDQWFGKPWQRLRPSLDYVKHSGPDDVPSEGIGFKQGRTFPHPLDAGLKQPGRLYYEAMTNSPMGNELLLALAKRAIDAEKLGQRDAPDLLCLSFSSNDLVGHCWGPDSQEVLDTTLRSDLIVKDLLDTLDAKVGRGKYVVVLCADHGVCPSPELTSAAGKKALRVAPKTLVKAAAAFLDDYLGNGKPQPWFESKEPQPPWLYLNQALLKEQGLKSAAVEKALADWLVKQPGVQAAYTRSQLSGKFVQDDAVLLKVLMSFHRERSGDVYVLQEPYTLFMDPLTSKRSQAYTTTHGTPYWYDTHVPLLVYGSGVAPGVRQERVTPLQVAPILRGRWAWRCPKGLVG